MGAFRWTAEAVADFEKRKAEWDKKSPVRTHRMDGVDIDAVHNKYGNVKSNGFASQREEKRYGELVLRQKAKQISELKCQVPFSLDVNGFHVCKYIADFTYVENGKPVVEDSKGYKTQTYKLKKKLLKACLGITILET